MDAQREAVSECDGERERSVTTVVRNCHPTFDWARGEREEKTARRRGRGTETIVRSIILMTRR